MAVIHESKGALQESAPFWTETVFEDLTSRARERDLVTGVLWVCLI